MKKIITITIAAVFSLVAVGIVAVFQLNGKNEIIQEQETKIEALEESNASLQQERDEVYEDYAILRDYVWNLNNSLEKETNQ